MRIVMLCSSIYSETACATALHLAEIGYTPVGALSVGTLHAATLRRKVGQWGLKRAAQYARKKVFSGRIKPDARANEAEFDNPHLSVFLRKGKRGFRNLKEVGAEYQFPVKSCSDQNSAASIGQLREWKPDVVVFTGGNILRREILEIPRLGVVNVHLGLLPEIRGMSSVEWAMLTGVPPGVTLHFMDRGIDTGPVLRRYRYAGGDECTSLNELRQKLIAFGVEKLGEVIAELSAGLSVATPQMESCAARREYNDGDNQFFVMHEWLRARAAERLGVTSGART